jgi:hypothetical protein
MRLAAVAVLVASCSSAPPPAGPSRAPVTLALVGAKVYPSPARVRMTIRAGKVIHQDRRSRSAGRRR